MRRLLRDVAEGRALGDTTTLADPNVVHALRDRYEAAESYRGMGRAAVKIHEYQAKEILRKNGVPTLPGQIATTPNDARNAAETLGCRSWWSRRRSTPGGGERAGESSWRAARTRRAKQRRRCWASRS